MTACRVLHVLGALDYGGIETWLLQVMRRIDPKVIRMDYCCLSGRAGRLAPEFMGFGGSVYPIRLALPMIGFNARFGRLLRSGRYDAVHSHVHKFSGYILWRAARAGIETRIAHSFTSYPLPSRSPVRRIYGQAMDRLLRRYATLGLGNSSRSMSSLFGPNWSSDPSRRILYCGIDVAAYECPQDRRSIRARWGIPEGANVVGHVGRFSPEKNHGFIIDLAAELMKRRDDIWFLLIGDGELRGRTVERARFHGLDRIVFTGNVPDADVIAGLGSIDLYLFPSLREGLPQAVLEAQASGLRCLCSDTITAEVAVVPGAVHFLPLASPLDEWADRCLDLLRAPKLERAVIREHLICGPFDIARSAGDLAGIYGAMKP